MAQTWIQVFHWRKLELQKQPAGFVSAGGLCCHRYCASTLWAPTPSPYCKGFGLFLLSTETWHYGSTKVSIYAVHKAGKFLTPCIKVWETWMLSGGFLHLPFYFIFFESIGARQIVRQNFLESCLEQHLKCVILGAFRDFCITKWVPTQPSVKKWCMESPTCVFNLAKEHGL